MNNNYVFFILLFMFQNIKFSLQGIIDIDQPYFTFQHPKTIYFGISNSDAKYYRKNDFYCAKGFIFYQDSSPYPSDQEQFHSVFDNCSYIPTLYERGYYISYTLAVNYYQNSSTFDYYYEKKHIDKKTILINLTNEDAPYLYFGADEEEQNNTLTYKIEDKWSFPFDFICLDSNCTEHYDNKYPVLFEPFANYFMVPYDFIEYIKNKFYSEEFKNGNCYYKTLTEVSGIFHIKCDEYKNEFKKNRLAFLHNYKGIQINEGNINYYYSMENYTNWLLIDKRIKGKYFLNYDNKTITVYNNIVDYTFMKKIVHGKLIKIIMFINFFVMLAGIGVSVVIKKLL